MRFVLGRVVLVVIALAIVAGGAWAIGEWRTDVEALATSATAVSAAFAALAAWNSSRAAHDTAVLAQRTNEALARAVKPTVLHFDVHVEAGQTLGRIMFGDDAVDVTVDWRLRDGRHVRRNAHRVPGYRQGVVLEPGSDLSFSVVLQDRPHDGEHHLLAESVTVIYSDERRIGRWQFVGQFREQVYANSEPGLGQTVRESEESLLA